MRHQFSRGYIAVPPAPPIPSLSQSQSFSSISDAGTRNHSLEFSSLPATGLKERLDRLESCVESELRATMNMCRSVMDAAPSSENRIRSLEASFTEVSQKLKQCATSGDLAKCLTEADWVTFQQRLDERFGSQMARTAQHRIDTDSASQTWRDMVDERCNSLERCLADCRATQTSEEAVVRSAIDRVSKEFLPRLDSLEDRYKEHSATTHQHAAKFGALEDIKSLRQMVTDQRAQSLELEKRVTASTSEASSLARQQLEASAADLRSQMAAATQTINETVDHKFESMETKLESGVWPSTFGQWHTRLSRLEQRGEGVNEVVQGQCDRSATRLRTEFTTSLEAATQKSNAALDEVRRSSASFKKEAEAEFKEVHSASAVLAKQLQQVLEDVRASGDRARSMHNTIEEGNLAIQRAESKIHDLDTCCGTLRETSQHQVELLGRDLRAEFNGNLESCESRHCLAMKEMQNDVSALKKDLERVSRDFQDLRGSVTKQVQTAVEEARSASEKAAISSRSGQEAQAAAESADRRLKSFEERVDSVLDGYQQQITRGASDLRSEASMCSENFKRQLDSLAEEIRGVNTSFLKQIDRTAAEIRSEIESSAETFRNQVSGTTDELRAASSTLTVQMERMQHDIAESDDRLRTAVQLSEEAKAATQNTDSRHHKLESRIEESVESRCQRVECAVKDMGTESKAHVNTVAKRQNGAVEDLTAAIASLSKQVQTALDDSRRADERGVVVANVAQEAAAAVQRLENTVHSQKKSDIGAGAAKNLRDQLDNTATDLRLDAKRALETLGREVESSISELRGTVSSLALQVECGVSGSTSVLADAVDTAAQRHVDHLEWLKNLDTHRGQMEKQQAELEERLSAMLSAQKVALQADIQVTHLQTGQQLAKLEELSSNCTRTSCGLENLWGAVTALETHLHARSVEWDTFSESMRDRVGSLQAGIAENKWGMVTIAGAIGTISTRPELSNEGTCC